MERVLHCQQTFPLSLFGSGRHRSLRDARGNLEVRQRGTLFPRVSEKRHTGGLECRQTFIKAVLTFCTPLISARTPWGSVHNIVFDVKSACVPSKSTTAVLNSRLYPKIPR